MVELSVAKVFTFNILQILEDSYSVSGVRYFMKESRNLKVVNGRPVTLLCTGILSGRGKEIGSFLQHAEV